jgi:cell division protease FtsH
MVTKWGLGKKLVRRNYAEERGSPFMGHSAEGGKVSGSVAEAIDKEIDEIIDRNYAKAEKILKGNMSILHAMADALMKWETINKDQIDDLMSGKDARDPVDAEEIMASIAKRKYVPEKKSELVKSS